MSHCVSELEMVGLMKSYLAKPRGTATAEESEAWDDFCSVHYQIIRAVIRRIHKAPDVVADLTQQVMVNMIEALKGLRFDPTLGSFTAWVVKIASNIAKTHARLQSRRREQHLAAEMADKLADPEPGPVVEFELVQDEADLRALIESFAAALRDDRERCIVREYWLNERLLSRIAADMMISEDCAKGIRRQVSVKLADYLGGRGYRAPREKNEKVLPNSDIMARLNY